MVPRRIANPVGIAGPQASLDHKPRRTPLTMTATVALRPLSVSDYHRMAEAGIFHPDEQIELLDGQLRRMAAKGTAHRAGTQRTRRLLEQRLGSQAQVCVQDPVQLNDNSEPEPDIAVVVPDPFDYVAHHPRPQDVLLLVEVSDWTIRYDTGEKAVAYSRSQIPDYWVLDVNQRQLHVFREPAEQGYQQHLILESADGIAPLAFPACHLNVSEMLPIQIPDDASARTTEDGA